MKRISLLFLILTLPISAAIKQTLLPDGQLQVSGTFPKVVPEKLFTTSGTSDVAVDKKHSVVQKHIRFALEFDVFDREVILMTRMYGWPRVPKLMAVDFKNNNLYMEYAGERISKKNIPDDWKDQCSEILEGLARYNVRHNDTKYSEVMVKDKFIRLIDFNWSANLHEESPKSRWKIGSQPGDDKLTWDKKRILALMKRVLSKPWHHKTSKGESVKKKIIQEPLPDFCGYKLPVDIPNVEIYVDVDRGLMFKKYFSYESFLHDVEYLTVMRKTGLVPRILAADYRFRIVYADFCGVPLPETTRQFHAQAEEIAKQLEARRIFLPSISLDQLFIDGAGMIRIADLSTAEYIP